MRFIKIHLHANAKKDQKNSLRISIFAVLVAFSNWHNSSEWVNIQELTDYNCDLLARTNTEAEWLAQYRLGCVSQSR